MPTPPDETTGTTEDRAPQILEALTGIFNPSGKPLSDEQAGALAGTAKACQTALAPLFPAPSA